MGMLKGNSSSLNFDQLMAQATQVAKQQDAALMERARQKLREEEERRKREARAAREKEAAENARRLEQQQRKKTQTEQTKRQKVEPERRKSLPTKNRNVNSKRFPAATQSTTHSLLPEKKKPVHMSFEDLMKTAKQQSLNKPTTTTIPKSRSVEKPQQPRETLYHKPRKPVTTSLSQNDALSARERAKAMGAEVPKRVNTMKKDRRSITEIQREVRHSKGIYSDEEGEPVRKDARLISNKTSRYQSHTTPLPRKRQLSPPPPPKPVMKRPASIPSSRPAPPRRMPFSGRPLDQRNRGPPQRRRYEEEEEVDDELADFVVDDDEDDYNDRYTRNDYSDEISKMFRYDKNKYANEPVYSDDDMEANARDVLREEKRSERIARREDLIEEQKEMERLKKKKKR